MSIEKNKEDREWFDLMVEERGPRFWELCAEKLAGPVEEVEEELAMTADNARLFGHIQMSFGQHAGKKIKDVPMSYLEWYVNNSQPFIKALNSYIKYENGLE